MPGPDTLFFGHKRVTNSGKEGMMPRFSIGARVRVADEKTNDRIGTVVEVLPKSQQTGDYDSYRIEMPEKESPRSCGGLMKTRFEPCV
jgi:hypothetical protein